MTDTDPAAPREGQRIDWSEIHHRLERARQALAQGAALSPQESRAILRARARALAREPEQAATAQEVLAIIVFSLASETYGIDSTFVREVYPLKGLTPLPGVPPFVLGIVNVHGQILSVVGLKKFFDLPENGLAQLNKLIILRDEQMELGILADDVLGARSIARDAIQASPPTVSGIGAEYLWGVTAEGVIILDAQRFLDDEKIIVHQEAE
jgi:purine-binding chemotaxis protein CheW